MGRGEKELADRLARQLHLPARTSRKYIQALLELIREDLGKTGQSKLRGLGTLEVHERPGHHTHDLQTGADVEVPDYKTVQFRASKKLKNLLNPAKKKAKKPPKDGTATPPTGSTQTEPEKAGEA